MEVDVDHGVTLDEEDRAAERNCRGDVVEERKPMGSRHEEAHIGVDAEAPSCTPQV